MNKRLLIPMLMCLAGMGMAPSAMALEDIQFSGYFTMKATYGDVEVRDSSGNPTGSKAEYNHIYSDKLDFDTHGNHAGLKADASVADNLDVSLVFQAHGGPNHKYSVGVEWVYATYAMTDTFDLKVGKFKGPFFMVSEYLEVAYAYPWVTPPQEVYSTNPMSAVNGLDLLYNGNLGSLDFLFEVYGGSGNHDSFVMPNFVDDDPGGQATAAGLSKGKMVDFSTNNMIGFNTVIGKGGVSFRAGYFTTKVDVASFGISQATGTFGGVGLIVDWRNLLVYSEYIVRDTSNDLAAAFPDQKAWYLTLGYRFGNTLPYVTYGGMDKGADDSRYALKQTSATLGLRQEVSDTAAVKFEIHHAMPDADSTDVGKYGLFDSPVVNDKGTLFSASFDLIF
ncbi:MAG TPA: hypothetical protein ENJ11_06200 [Gammaproteobacteria bacterium]|nr:hypothetical protein [Gammaproteobacteria bacterium]